MAGIVVLRVRMRMRMVEGEVIIRLHSGVVVVGVHLVLDETRMNGECVAWRRDGCLRFE